jgi:hypothetical protein
MQIKGSQYAIFSSYQTAPSAIPFRKAFFWVRMKNLPLACMGREVGFKIGSSVGEVEEVDADMDGIG